MEQHEDEGRLRAVMQSIDNAGGSDEMAVRNVLSSG